MKFNRNTFKVILAFVVIVGVIFVAVDSVRSLSYSGVNLNFDTASGTITITNPSDDLVAAQFTGSGSRAFRVSSATEGMSGSSERIGSGSTRTTEFKFELPPGTSEFTVSGGTDVRFVAETDTELQAIVESMSSETYRNTLIAAAVMILIALYYAYNASGRPWIKSVLHKVFPSSQANSPQATEAVPVVIDEGGQGSAARAYGDNRAER